MYTTKGYFDTLAMWLSWFHLQLMGHMGMIMNEKVISSKCNCSIVAKMVKGAKYLWKQFELVSNDN